MAGPLITECEVDRSVENFCCLVNAVGISAAAMNQYMGSIGLLRVFIWDKIV